MLTTKLQKISSEDPDPRVIREATDTLEKGGLVAFPTETVYGLGADALNPLAVGKVFEAKGRPLDNPMIVHIASMEHLRELSYALPREGRILADACWPGPLTLVVQRSPRVSNLVSAGLETVAVRMPDHPVTIALIKMLGRGIVGPSANSSGKPSPTKAEHVYADLQGKIDLILDAGPTKIGVESTIIDVTQSPPVILRRGGLAEEEIREIIGDVKSTSDFQLLRRSPGTRHRHYAPRAEVVVVDENDLEHFRELIHSFQSRGKKVGCIVHSPHSATLKTKECEVVVVQKLEELSKKLFDTLRLFDRKEVDVILFEAVPERGIGAAIMDRITRAAGASVFEKNYS